MSNTPNRRTLSRRQLLEGAAALGIGGVVLAACGGDDSSSSTTAANSPGTTAAGGASTTAASSGGSKAATGGGGKDGTIKIGYVTPQTGALAPFGEADLFVLGALREFLKDGLQIGGKSYKIDIIDKDSESDSNKAAAAANDLITKDGVQLMCVAQTPDTTVPVVQACTNNEIPVLSNNAPWQPHYLGIGGKLGPNVTPEVASKWNYHFFWGLEDVIDVFTRMWADVAPGGVIGAMWPDDPDGNAWSDANVGFPPAITKAGFKLVDPGRFPLNSSDFTAQISKFKDAKVDIVTGVMIPPDFGNFWAQCQQQGFQPKAVTVGKCLLFPGAVASYKNPIGLSSEIWWSDRHPTKSSVTGQSAKQLADAYTASTKKQWTQPVGYVHSLFEVALDAIKRAGGASDKEALLQAMGATNLDTIAGKVDFTHPVVPNITKTPLIGGQWVKGSQYPVEFKIVVNDELPAVPLDGKLTAISY